jgi:hypothetical protein
MALMGIILAVGLGPFAAVLFTIGYLIATPIQLVIGNVPTEGFVGEYLAFWKDIFGQGRKGRNDFFTFRPYSPFQVGKFSFYPRHVVEIVLVVLFVVSLLFLFVFASVELFYYHSTYARIIAPLVVAVATIVTLVILAHRSGKVRDCFRLTKEFLKATKRQICPLIQFVDGESAGAD